ncbi:MAG TPA: methenyltetrahydromethanopterin cyclohydrolase [candidate division Zixibacteria bacterium]|nr:methenyltetrahydromethanopterin cyclohydrolase [candidate division Zixibacteria bacterium]
MNSQNEATITTMNEAAINLFEEILEIVDVLKGEVIETKIGSMIIDFGVNTQGGYLAGEYISQICMGGLAEVTLTLKEYSPEVILPSITVFTDFPVEATLGSQFAGWSIKKDNYQAIASGPARVLADKPKHIFKKIPMDEEIDEAVIVLESNEIPSDNIIKYIAEKCTIDPENLYIIVVPTASIAGSTQISARSIETALHKLFDLGMDVTKIIAASGSAPISPVYYENYEIMLGRTNDMLIYGSNVFLQVNTGNEKELLDFCKKAISNKSPNYGSLFYEIVKQAKGDFYKINPAIFAPAKLTVNNVKSGKTNSFGNTNIELIEKSINSLP